jgi:L-methionine (R)-S-oxide reductase
MPVHPRQVTPSLLHIDSILGHLTGTAALAEVARFLRAEFPHYRWVGVYRLDGPLLRLTGWSGDQPTEHETIPVGRGVCGRAARENRSVVVGDVSKDPEYIACFLETRSEIVVPIRDAGRVVGEIDIDGSVLNAYDASDVAFLERVAGRIALAVGVAAVEPTPP